MLAGLRFDKAASKEKEKKKKAKHKEEKDAATVSGGLEDVKASREIAVAPTLPERRSLSPCRIVRGGKIPPGDRGGDGDGSQRQPGSVSGGPLSSSPRGQEGSTSFLETSAHHGISPVAAARELNPFLRPADASADTDAPKPNPTAPFAVPATADTWRPAQTWRARQLRRLQERAAEKGDTTVGRLFEEHVGDSAALFPAHEATQTASASPSSRPWSRRVRESCLQEGRGGSFPEGARREDRSSPFSRKHPAGETDSSRSGSRSYGLDASRSASSLVLEDGCRKQSWREKVSLSSRGHRDNSGHQGATEQRWRTGDREREVTSFVFSRSSGEKEPSEGEGRRERGASRSPPLRPSSFASSQGHSSGSSSASVHSSSPRSREAHGRDDRTGRSDRLSEAASRAALPSAPASNDGRLAVCRPSSDLTPRSPADSVSSTRPLDPDADMNSLAAHALRAQLMGDRAASRRLEGVVARRQLSATNEELVRTGEAAVRTRDSRAASLPPWQKAAVTQNRAKPHQPGGDEPGSATQSGFDLRRERDSDQTNFDQACVAAVLRNRMYDEESDAAPPKVSEKKRRILEERDRMRGHRLNRQQGKCSRCLDTENFNRFHGAGVVTMATQAIVCFQSWRNCILRSHLLLLPAAHVSSVTTLDDAGYEELRNFQKSLVMYFKETRQEAPIFIETVSHFVSKEKLWMGAGPHTAIEVLPIPLDRLQEAKTYFRKAFEEAESEWQQHKRVIDVRGREGIRSAIPANIPYIHVDFALTDGLAHVIDDGRSFSPSFGREVIQGMLELSPIDRAFPTEQAFKNAVAAFRRDFSRFDWTETN
uniref:Protein cwfj c-terminus 1 family protein n=1 Tax=Neospora caninum (strain Liverpool) TaxID=572307 RepID=A0A0F7UL67_NEOCL|nr:TPA: protein cwfj c-terminus 1 family protein [Neospora caninum Liverpool]